MSSQLVDIFLLSLTAIFNPSLLAAVTVMLLLPNPKRLLVGYLLGAYLTSITLGLVIVFAVPGSSTESTSKHTISTLEDIVVGVLLWAVAFVLLTGRDQPFQERRKEKKDAKLKARQQAGRPTESVPLRMLGKGDPRLTLVVGVLLSFPGVSYLDALQPHPQTQLGNTRGHPACPLLLRHATALARSPIDRLCVLAGSNPNDDHTI